MWREERGAKLLKVGMVACVARGAVGWGVEERGVVVEGGV